MIEAWLAKWGAKLAILAVIVLGSMATGAYYMRQHDVKVYKKLEKEYTDFKAGVEAEGKVAARLAAVKAKEDKAKQEKADESNRNRAAVDERTIAGLRAAARQRDSRGGSVSAAPAGSQCPERQTCFDTAEYQRAIGEFDTGARRLADEGTKVSRDLDTAIEWAR